MSNLSKEQFNEILLDVRKAYRLLYLYQERVLDIVQYIGDNLDFRYDSGWSWFSNSSPKDGKGKLDNSAWDWLNMYFYEFNFSKKIIDNNSIMFSVLLESDTGYFDANATDVDVKGFSAVEQSSTRLVFMIGKNTWWTDFSNEFNDDNNEIYKKIKNEALYSNEKGKLAIKCFPLDRFINSEETKRCLDELITYLISSGITEFKVSQV
jgi:hypothetical protein